MNNRIHYENDLFAVHSMLQTLREAMSLELDFDLFADKIIEDIFFIDGCLERIYTSLKESLHLIQKPDYLRTLMKTKRVFADFLGNVLNGTFFGSELMQSVFSKFSALKTAHLQDIMDIQNELQNAESSPIETEEIISQEEFKYLFIYE